MLLLYIITYDVHTIGNNNNNNNNIHIASLPYRRLKYIM